MAYYVQGGVSNGSNPTSLTKLIKLNEMATLGEIAKSHGFNNLSDFVNKINEEVVMLRKKSFNVGDKIQLKPDYVPTHFNDEKVLPFYTEFTVTEKSEFTLWDYCVKIKGYDIWFDASVFEFSK